MDARHLRTDTLVVTGTGTAAARPDRYVVDLQLQGQGLTVSQALAALTDASRAAHELLPGQVSTHGLGLHPRYDNAGQPTGHTAFQSARVTSTDPAQVGDLVSRLGETVGDSLVVQGLHPEVSDLAKVQLTDRAREAAWADALHRARALADHADRSLGDVLWATEEDPSSPGPVAAKRMLMADPGGPTVNPGELEVGVTVRVCWALA